MGPEGLKEVADPSRLFLPAREGALPPGIATVPVWEGSRALVVEIQALVVPAKAGLSRVYSDKIDSARVSRIAAVVERHAGMRLSDHDIYVNVAGGLRLAETGIDLGLALALQSARSGISLPRGLAYAGELSLAGELRPVPRMRQRYKAAQTLGFDRLLGPEPSFDEKDERPGWEPRGFQTLRRSPSPPALSSLLPRRLQAEYVIVKEGGNRDAQEENRRAHEQDRRRL